MPRSSVIAERETGVACAIKRKCKPQFCYLSAYGVLPLGAAPSVGRLRAERLRADIDWEILTAYTVQRRCKMPPAPETHHQTRDNEDHEHLVHHV